MKHFLLHLQKPYKNISDSFWVFPPLFLTELSSDNSFFFGRGAKLPDVIGGAAGCFGVALFPRSLRDRARAVWEQLVPEITGETSRAVW